MDELELLFEDEAKVYLPQVVANENERKVNEEERKANETERQKNESQRIKNEESRIKSMENFEAMKDELIASVKKISFLKEYKVTYTTTTNSEHIFKLPSEYTETSMVWVYVNGMKLNVNEYTIDTTNLLVILTNVLDVIGTVVEIVAYRLTTASEEDYDTLKGEGVPAGGTTGQVLVKKSDKDNDTEWKDSSGVGGTSLPVGGTAGQVLVKDGDEETDLKWIDIPKEEDSGWVDIPITNSQFTPTTRGYGSACSGIQYRKIGTHVYVRAGLEAEANAISGETEIAKMPEEILPKMGLETKQAGICFMFCGTGQAMGRGQISCYQGRNVMTLDYLRNFSITNYNITSATWIGFYFDYFID